MDTVRAAVIGYGGMGSIYAQMLYHNEVDGMALAGICCRNAKGQAEIRERYPDVSIYRDTEDTFDHREEFDAVVIVTPHATHVEIGLAAAKAGKHILMDKPAGVSTKEVKVLLEAVKEAGVSYGMIFNTRMSGAYEKAKDMLVHGEIGRLTSAVWVCNTWFRTPAYHNSAPWRSTWKGEHGGLLINQCQHYLDIWQWLFGMPEAVRASIDYGKFGRIAVDDGCVLQFRCADGLRGTFISSSGENPGVNRLEIWGRKGCLRIEDGLKLSFDENIMPTDEFARTNQEVYGKLEHHIREIPVEDFRGMDYQRLFQNFADHIRKGTALYADGNEGLKVLSMANGAYLSSWLEKEIVYPMDDELYAKMLEEKVQNR